MKRKLINPEIISENHDTEGREQILATISSAESELETVKKNSIT